MVTQRQKSPGNEEGIGVLGYVFDAFWMQMRTSSAHALS